MILATLVPGSGVVFDWEGIEVVRGGLGTTGMGAVVPAPVPRRGRRQSPQPAYVQAAPVARGRLDLLRLAIWSVVFLSIGRMHQHFPFLAVFRPALVLVGLATLLAVFQPRLLNHGSIFSTWQAKIVAGIGAVAICASPFGISLGASAVFIIADYSKTLVLCFLVIAAIRHARDLMVVSWAFVAGCAFLVYLSLFYFQLSHVGGVTRLNDLYMYDANDINSILVIGMGLVALLTQAYTGPLKWGAIMLLLGMGAAVARSGSRAGFLGLLVVGASLLVSLNRVAVSKRIAFVAMMGLGLLLFAPPGYWAQMKTILAPTEDYNWSAEDGRKEIWTRGTGYMMQYPLFGLGINNFARAECTIGPKARDHVEGTGLTCTAPHNTYLQVGAELGFVGLTLWVVMLVGAFFKMRQLARRVPRHWEWGDPEARFLFFAPRYLPICLAAFAVTSFFVSHAYLDPIYLLLALMAGTYAAAAERGRREQFASVAPR